jgi:hypothetical protein
MSNGRFAKAYCGNPNGRPPKQKPELGQALLAALAEELPVDGGDILSMEGMLTKIVIRAAAGDPKLALKLLMFIATHRGSSRVEQTDAGGTDDQIIAEFIRRQGRGS